MLERSTLSLIAVSALLAATAGGCSSRGEPPSSEHDITNGTPAKRGELDGTLSIAIGGFPACTAQKVGPRMLLTAAHCFVFDGKPSEAVAAGSSIHVSNKKAFTFNDLSEIPGASEATYRALELYEKAASLSAAADALAAELEQLPAGSEAAKAKAAEHAKAVEASELALAEHEEALAAMEAFNTAYFAQAKADLAKHYLQLKIASAHVFPAYLEAKGEARGHASTTGASDIALIEVAPDSDAAWAAFSAFPSADIDARPVESGDEILIAGYGDDGDEEFDLTKQVYALHKGTTRVLPGSNPLVREGIATIACGKHEDAVAAAIGRSYFFSPIGEGIVSSGPGDSGGPVIRVAASGQSFLVGLITGAYDDGMELCSPEGGKSATRELVAVYARFNDSVIDWLKGLGAPVKYSTQSLVTGAPPTKVEPKPSRPACAGWGSRCVEHAGKATYVYCANGQAASFFAAPNCASLL